MKLNRKLNRKLKTLMVVALTGVSCVSLFSTTAIAQPHNRDRKPDARVSQSPPPPPPPEPERTPPPPKPEEREPERTPPPPAPPASRR